MAHPIAKYPRTKKVQLGKSVFEVYSISWFALCVRRRPGAIKIWESRGILPRPLLDVGRHRYYTANEILGYAAAFRQSGAKTGTRIEETPFRRLCADVRSRMRKLLSYSPEKVFKELPNKKQLMIRSVELLRTSLVRQMRDEHDDTLAGMLTQAEKTPLKLRIKR